MSENVVRFPGITRLDIPADDVLDNARAASLHPCVVVGFTESGEFFFASSVADAADVVYLMRMAEHKLMKIAEEMADG